MFPAWVSSVLSLVREGASSNWWGLGCPSYCQGSGPVLLLATFAAGLFCGIVLALLVAGYIYLFLLRSPTLPSRQEGRQERGPARAGSRSSRLRGYLHAEG